MAGTCRLAVIVGFAALVGAVPGALSCSSDTSKGDGEDPDPAPGSAAGDGESGEAADDGGRTDTGDDGGGVQPGPTTRDYLFTSFHLLPEGQGFDLDGDGSVDNAVVGWANGLWTLLKLLDPDALETFDLAVMRLLTTCAWSLLVQIDEIADMTADPQVIVRFLAGQDLEDPPDCDNNFEGGAEFRPDPTWVDPVTKELVMAIPGAIEQGSLRVPPTGRVPFSLHPGGEEVAVELFAFQVDGPIAPAEISQARAGFAVSVSGIEALLPFFLPAEYVEAASTLMATAPDVDTDGDGEDDAISVAIRFRAIPAKIR